MDSHRPTSDSRRRSFHPKKDRARPAALPIDPDLPPPLGDAARDLAFRRLSRQAVRFPQMEIAGLDDSHSSMRTIDERDAAFAHAIYDAAVRRWLTLRALLAPMTSQPFDEMEARLRGALMGAAAQITFLDRVPVHAVINHAVEWCKVRIRPGAGAVANAVLRRFAALVLDPAGDKRRRDVWNNEPDEIPLADGAALVLSDPCLPPDELERLGVAASYPLDLLRAWHDRTDIREVVRLARHGLASPPTILNVRHMKRAAAHDGSLESLTTPHASPSHAVYTGSRAELRLFLQSRHDVWVQDAGASGAVESIADLKINRGLIVDLCAGQGTKTRQLMHLFPNATIVATDVDGPRRETLARVFEGSKQVRVLSMKQVRDECLEKSDLILLDVPCSNTGVLARRPEAKYRYSREAIESLTNVQRQIIADTIPFLSRGDSGERGRILYSTCSLERDENEAIAGPGGWARQWHQFDTSRERRESPNGAAGDDPSIYRDGAYSVLLSH